MTPPFDYERAREIRLSDAAEKPDVLRDRVAGDDLVGRPLGGLLPVQEVVNRLAELGVTTVGAMLARCAEPAGRTALAERLRLDDIAGIDAGWLERWAFRLDLLRIQGITPEFAAMLERVGAGSIADLRDRRADRLSDAMLAMQSEQPRAGIVPSAALIDAWIRQAAHLQPLVSEPKSESRRSPVD